MRSGEHVLSFSQESTKERPGTSRMVPGLSRRLKGHIHTAAFSNMTDIAPLESPVVLWLIKSFSANRFPDSPDG